jgi:hypothetical protein
MSQHQSHLSHRTRLISRRSALQGAAAGVAGAIAGVWPLRAQTYDERYEARMLDALIAMDDVDVRKDVGTTFIQYLKCWIGVKGAFFADAKLPAIDPQFTTGFPDPLRNSCFALAEALVAWALANTSSYGFNGTVNGQKAENRVKAFCNPQAGKGFVVRISEILYTFLFLHQAPSGSQNLAWFYFADKRGGSESRSHYADLLSAALISDPFFTRAMARKQADSANFPQYVYLQLFKLRALAGSTSDPGYTKVFDKWNPYTDGRPWTTYQYLSFDKFSEQTFMPEVQAAINAATVVGHHSGASFCAGGPNARCHVTQIDDYNHGLAVEAWLNGGHLVPDLFTGATPDNKK